MIYKIFQIHNLQKISIVIFFYFTYFYNNKYYVQTIDYLNQAYVYKTIKRQYFNFFDLDLIIPNFLNGYKYNYLIPSEFHLTSILEYLLGVENSELVIQIIGRMLIIYFSLKIFNKFSQNNIAVITAATFVGVSDFWPIITTSILAMVISMYLYFYSKEDTDIKNILLVLILPFLYEIQLGGLWIFVFMSLTLLKSYLNKRRIKDLYLLFLSGIFLLLNNYRLFYEIFFGAETVRNYSENKIFNLDIANFQKFFREFIKVNIEGHWHINTSVKYFIFPVISLFFLFVVFKFFFKKEINDNEKLFLKIYLLVQILNLIYSIDRSGVFSLNALFGLRTNLWRIVIFNQILNPLLLLLCISKIRIKVFVLVLFLSSFVLNGSAKEKIITPETFDNFPTNTSNALINFGQRVNYLDYLLMRNWNNALPFLSTYGSPLQEIEEYYMTSSFNEYILQEKNIDDFRFVSYNIDPMIGGYHGLKIVDGYFNLYEKKYNKEFRKVIEKELDYLGPSGTAYYDNFAANVTLFIKNQNPSYNLDQINFCELISSIGATHMLSGKYINPIDFENNKYIDLEFENNDLFVYRLTKPSYCN